MLLASFHRTRCTRSELEGAYNSKVEDSLEDSLMTASHMCLDPLCWHHAIALDDAHDRTHEERKQSVSGWRKLMWTKLRRVPKAIQTWPRATHSTAGVEGRDGARRFILFCTVCLLRSFVKNQQSGVWVTVQESRIKVLINIRFHPGFQGKYSLNLGVFHQNASRYSHIDNFG